VEGQLLRSNNQRRTFVLSRAFFAGSQRYGETFMTLTHKQTERRPLYYNVRNRQHLFLGQPFVSGRVIYSLLRNFGLVSV